MLGLSKYCSPASDPHILISSSSRSYGFGAGMGMGGMSAHPLTNPMGGYYPDLHGMTASQFMSSSSMFGSHANPPLNLSHHSLGSHSQFS